MNKKTPENKEIATIPSKAVIFDNDKNFVIIFKSRTNIKIKEIKILKKEGDTVYVSEGLLDGEKVITTNQLPIYDTLKQ